MMKLSLLIAASLSCAALLTPAYAKQSNAAGVATQVIITVEARRGKTVPPVEAQDLEVDQGRDKRPITSLTPLPATAESQLLILIDDSSQGTFDTEIPTLKQFVQSLPPNIQVGVGYMENGLVRPSVSFTADHAQVASEIRVVEGPGGADVSPYDSLSYAVKHWPGPKAQRREVLMISSGIEGLGGGANEDNPYVNAGIDDALRAGVLVYAIYNPSVGHFGHSFWRATWGQNFLSQMAEETGGEAYITTVTAPVSFQPFLAEFLEAQQHQYTLSFIAKAEKKTDLQAIRVKVREKDASVAAPEKVLVPAGL